MTSLIKATSQPTLATDFRMTKGGERLVGQNGEINASSKTDALSQSLKLAQAASQGLIATASDMANRQKQVAVNKELISAAFTDPNAHRILGEKISENVYMTANRKGYMRRVMNRQDLKQGDIPRFQVRQKNVQAMIVTGPTKVEPQIVTGKWVMPPEFQVVTRVFVPQNDINQSNSDQLETVYVEALEGTMVTEDRIWMNAARQTIGVDNNQTIISGTLSPLTFMNARQGVARWGMKPMYAIMANDLYVDIVGDASFIQAIEPVTRHELIMTGELAVLYGMTIISEAYRHPEHKVLQPGEFVIVSDPAFHGAYSDRGGVDSQPLDSTTEKIPGRGWLLTESMALSIANTRSVSFGLRV